MAETKKEATKPKTAKAPAKKATPEKTEAKETKTTKVETTTKKGSEGFAVIETGGKQYRVSVGDVIATEIITDKGEGDKVTFDQVLMTGGSAVSVGTPTVKGASVTGEIIELGKGKKISVLRFRPKSRHRRKIGHRQQFAKVKILSI